MHWVFTSVRTHHYVILDNMVVPKLASSVWMVKRLWISRISVATFNSCDFNKQYKRWSKQRSTARVSEQVLNWKSVSALASQYRIEREVKCSEEVWRTCSPQRNSLSWVVAPSEWNDIICDEWKTISWWFVNLLWEKLDYEQITDTDKHQMCECILSQRMIM